MKSYQYQSREMDRTICEEGDIDKSKEINELLNLVSLFVNSTTETFFDDSLILEIIKLGNYFNYFSIGNSQHIKDLGFFDALFHYA